MEAFLQNSEIIFRIIKETTPSLYLIISLITEPPKRIKMKEMNIAYLSSAYLAPVEQFRGNDRIVVDKCLARVPLLDPAEHGGICTVFSRRTGFGFRPGK